MFSALSKAAGFLFWGSADVQQPEPEEDTADKQELDDTDSENNSLGIQGKVTSVHNGYGIINNDIYFSFDCVVGGARPKQGSVVNVLATRESKTSGWKAQQVSLVSDEVWDENQSEEKKTETNSTSVIVGQVTQATNCQGTVNGSIIFDREVLPGDYTPYRGDWVTCDSTKNEVTGFSQATKVTPLRSKDFTGEINTVFQGYGYINKEIYVQFDACTFERSYHPRRGDRVCGKMIESNQGKCNWRAICVGKIPTQDSSGRLLQQMPAMPFSPMQGKFSKELLEDKQGISVTKSANFGKVVIGHKKALTLWIRNGGNSPKTFLRSHYHGHSSSQFTVHPPKLMSNNSQKRASKSPPEAADAKIQLYPGWSIAVQVECLPKNYGQEKQLLVFEFEDMKIGRYLTVQVEDESSRLLQPSAPYERSQFRHRFAEQRNSGDGWLIPGIRPQLSRKGIHLPNRLGQYPLPTDLRDSIYNDDNPSIILYPVLRQPLCIENYSTKFSLLLHLEEIQMEIDIREYDLERMCLRPVGEFLALKVPGLAEGRPSLIIGDKVILSNPGEEEGPQFEGYVHEVLNEEVLLKFHASFHNDFFGKDYDVEFTFNRTPLRRCHQAVAFAEKLGKEILFPTNLALKRSQVIGRVNEAVKEVVSTKSKTSEVASPRTVSKPAPGKENSPSQRTTLGSSRKENDSPNCDKTTLIKFERKDFKKSRSPSVRHKFFNPVLNERQKAAVLRILGGQCRPVPYILFGPPGTGKTVTVVESVLQIFHHIPSSRILVCAPSNSAADLLAERLHLSSQINKGDMVRLNAFQRQVDVIPEIIQPYSMYADDLDHVSRHRIVVCTCATAGSFYGLRLMPGHFTHAFIDEAGQATEPECVVTMGLVANADGETVLAGDPMQLGPVLRSKHSIEHGLQESFLERLINLPLYQRDEQKFAGHGCYDPFLVTKLVNNYRSHPALLTLPSRLFYHNELQMCADTEMRESMCHWEMLPNPECPLIFHGIRGEDLREGNSPSWFNPVEAVQVMKYLQNLVNYKGHELSYDDIGIITPYRKQVEKIRLLIDRLDMEKVKVGSVEEFQGQERPVMIVSTVRSHSRLVNFDLKYNLGFLSNPKRFNVAITRPQALLIIVGNPHVLAQDHYWVSLLQYCVDSSCYTGCDLPDCVRPAALSAEDKKQYSNDAAPHHYRTVYDVITEAMVKDDAEKLMADVSQEGVQSAVLSCKEPLGRSGTSEDGQRESAGTQVTEAKEATVEEKSAKAEKSPAKLQTDQLVEKKESVDRKYDQIAVTDNKESRGSPVTSEHLLVGQQVKVSMEPTVVDECSRSAISVAQCPSEQSAELPSDIAAVDRKCDLNTETTVQEKQSENVPKCFKKSPPLMRLPDFLKSSPKASQSDHVEAKSEIQPTTVENVEKVDGSDQVEGKELVRPLETESARSQSSNSKPDWANIHTRNEKDKTEIVNIDFSFAAKPKEGALVCAQDLVENLCSGNGNEKSMNTNNNSAVCSDDIVKDKQSTGALSPTLSPDDLVNGKSSGTENGAEFESLKDVKCKLRTTEIVSEIDKVGAENKYPTLGSDEKKNTETSHVGDEKCQFSADLKCVDSKKWETWECPKFESDPVLKVETTDSPRKICGENGARNDKGEIAKELVHEPPQVLVECFQISSQVLESQTNGPCAESMNNTGVPAAEDVLPPSLGNKRCEAQSTDDGLATCTFISQKICDELSVGQKTGTEFLKERDMPEAPGPDSTCRSEKTDIAVSRDEITHEKSNCSVSAQGVPNSENVPVQEHGAVSKNPNLKIDVHPEADTTSGMGSKSGEGSDQSSVLSEEAAKSDVTRMTGVKRSKRDLRMGRGRALRLLAMQADISLGSDLTDSSSPSSPCSPDYAGSTAAERFKAFLDEHFTKSEEKCEADKNDEGTVSGKTNKSPEEDKKDVPSEKPVSPEQPVIDFVNSVYRRRKQPGAAGPEEPRLASRERNRPDGTAPGRKHQDVPPRGHQSGGYSNTPICRMREVPPRFQKSRAGNESHENRDASWRTGSKMSAEVVYMDNAGSGSRENCPGSYPWPQRTKSSKSSKSADSTSSLGSDATHLNGDKHKQNCDGWYETSGKEWPGASSILESMKGTDVVPRIECTRPRFRNNRNERFDSRHKSKGVNSGPGGQKRSPRGEGQNLMKKKLPESGTNHSWKFSSDGTAIEATDELDSSIGAGRGSPRGNVQRNTCHRGEGSNQKNFAAGREPNSDELDARFRNRRSPVVGRGKSPNRLQEHAGYQFRTFVEQSPQNDPKPRKFSSPGVPGFKFESLLKEDCPPRADHGTSPGRRSSDPPRKFTQSPSNPRNFFGHERYSPKPRIREGKFTLENLENVFKQSGKIEQKEIKKRTPDSIPPARDEVKPKSDLGEATKLQASLFSSGDKCSPDSDMDVHPGPEVQLADKVSTYVYSGGQRIHASFVENDTASENLGRRIHASVEKLTAKPVGSPKKSENSVRSSAQQSKHVENLNKAEKTSSYGSRDSSVRKFVTSVEEQLDLSESSDSEDYHEDQRDSDVVIEESYEEEFT